MQINMLHLLNSLLRNKNILVSEPSSFVKNFNAYHWFVEFQGFYSDNFNVGG